MIGKRRCGRGRDHGLLPHLRRETRPVLAVGAVTSERRGGAEPPIPLQPVPQVGQVSTYVYTELTSDADAESFSIRFISPLTLRPIPSSHLPTPLSKSSAAGSDQAPEGTVKSVLPCTPLAIVKVLEQIGVYNKMLEYGDRARGKVITVINRLVVIYYPSSTQVMWLIYPPHLQLLYTTAFLLCTRSPARSPRRSEVVGRPLAALLANDGARVLSVDIDCECHIPRVCISRS